MDVSRRKFIRSAALATAASTVAPGLLLGTSRNAYAGTWSTLKKGEPIKVGILFSLTGELAVPEADSTRVMQYAIDKINAEGGIHGSPIQPIIVDAKSSMNVYAQKMRELILRDGVISVFGCYTSSSRKAVLPTVTSQDNLLFYPTCYEGEECVQNIVCTGPLANQQSKDLIPYMIKHFGKRVFFVGSNYVWPKVSNKIAKAWLKEAGGELLGEEYIPLGGSDFGPILGKIRDSKPDFIFSTVVGSSSIAFYHQYYQAGFRAHKMPIASLTTGELQARAMGSKYCEGHFLSAPYFESLDNPTNHKFVEGFLKSKYGKSGVTYYNMEETYNSAFVFKEALEKAITQHGFEAVTPALIRDAAAGVRLDASVSPEGLIWIDKENFNTWLVPKIGQCQSNGMFKVVEQAKKHIRPEPFILEAGEVCTADGLKLPSGKIEKNVF